MQACTDLSNIIARHACAESLLPLQSVSPLASYGLAIGACAILAAILARYI